MSNFDRQLQQGKVGESEIARWLMYRGNHVLPVYEIEKNQFAGPAFYSASGSKIIAPDLLTFNGDNVIWVEAKHKNAFSWHRITQRFVTGIDLHHYKEYQRIMRLVKWPVWLLFLHRNGCAKDSKPGPSGLYGNDLSFLIKNENHQHENHGKSGMVYWAEDSLIKLANYPIVYKEVAA